MADRSLDLQCQAASLGDVAGIDEIAALLPILENQWRALVEQPSGENGQNSTVGFDSA